MRRITVKEGQLLLTEILNKIRLLQSQIDAKAAQIEALQEVVYMFERLNK